LARGLNQTKKGKFSLPESVKGSVPRPREKDVKPRYGTFLAKSYTVIIQ